MAILKMTTNATITIHNALDFGGALDFVSRAKAQIIQISPGPEAGKITLRAASFGVQCEAVVAARHKGFVAPVMVPRAALRGQSFGRDEILNLRISDQVLHGAGPGGTFDFNILADDSVVKWLDLPTKRAPVVVDRKAFLAALKATVYAVSEEETRYSLCGVHFCNAPEGHPVAVATDGHRLVEYSLRDVFASNLLFRPFTLPHQAARVLEMHARNFKGDTVKIFGPAFGLPLMHPSGKNAPRTQTLAVQSADGSRTVLAAEIDAAYPDWPRVARNKKVSFDRAPMVVKIEPNALVGMRALAKDWGGVKIDSKAQTISLAQVAHGAPVSDAPVLARKIQTVSQAPFTIGFNPAYLEAILNRHGPITLRAVSSGDAALVTADKDPRVRIMLMPLLI